MAKELKIRITGDASGLKKGTDDAEGILSGFGSKISAFSVASGQLLADGIKTGASAAVGFIGDSISSAGDLNETISKSQVLFGDSFAGVEEFASGAATSLGQSKQEALDAAATFAVFGKSAGLSGQELADFATANDKLAVDMASFGNTSSEEAIEAIGAAFRGEAEPIRKYGILLDDATLRQKALELGLISTTKDALTPQQKVLAAQAAITEQAADAADDFAETSGGLAGQQKILGAQFENLKTTVGQAFLPVVLDLVTAFNTKVLPTLQKFGPVVAEKLAGGIRSVVGWVRELVAVFQEGGWKAALGSLGDDLWGWINTLGQWMNTVALPAVGGWLLELGKKFGTWITDSAVPYLVANLPGWIMAIEGWYYGTAVPWALDKMWQFAKTFGGEWVPAAADYLAANLPIWGQKFDDWMVGTALPWLTEKAQELAVKLADWVPDAANYLLRNLPVWIGKFTAWWNTEGYPKVIEVAGQLVTKFMGVVASIGGEMVGIGVDIVQGIIDGIWSMAGTLSSSVSSFITSNIPGQVRSLLGISSPSKVFEEIGRQSAQGLALGLAGGGGLVSSAATGLARHALAGYSPADLAGGMTVGSLGAPGMGWKSADRTVVVEMDGREVGRGLYRPAELNSRATR